MNSQSSEQDFEQDHEEDYSQAIENCFSSYDDTDSIEKYLAGCEDSDIVDIASDYANTFENILPAYFTPLESVLEGTILVKGNETLEDLNKRKIRLVLRSYDGPREESPPEDEWKYVKVTVNAGVPCYYWNDNIYETIEVVVTKNPITIISGEYYIV
jgi:hypothetical protein